MGQLSVVKCFLDAGRIYIFFASLKILKASKKLIQLKYLVRNQFYKLCHFHLLKLAHVLGLKGEFSETHAYFTVAECFPLQSNNMRGKVKCR